MLELNPFYRAQSLYEKKARLASTISSMCKGKKRKYITYDVLKKELDADDDEFDLIMSDAKKANRHSNKYIFTEVDGKPAIGITAMKRAKKKAQDDSDSRDVESSDVSVTGTKPEDQKDTEPTKVDDVGVSGKKMNESRIDPTVEANLWRAYKQYGWKGLVRAGDLPDGHEKMAVSEVIEIMARV